MVLFVLVFLLIFHIAQGFGVSIGCLHEKFCDCSEDEVVCTDTTQKETLNVGFIFSEPFSNLTIRGFRRVVVNHHFLQATKPRTVLFTNITTLNIKPHAFVSSEVADLEISHVPNLLLESYSLFQLTNVTRIMLRNVTSNYLPSHVFYLFGQDLNFSIEDCNFGTMYSYSVQVFDVTRFVLKDTRIDNVDRETFNITGITSGESSVEFSNVTFERLSIHAFTVDTLSEFTIRECDFGMISTMFLSGNDIDVFSYISNKVNNSDFHLFQELKAKISYFTSNSFVSLYNMSLPLDQLPNEWVFEKNYFPCDCDSKWLFNVSSKVLQHNFCFSNSLSTDKDSFIAQLEPIWSNGPGSECLGLQKREFVSTTSRKDTLVSNRNASNPNGSTLTEINTSLVIFLFSAVLSCW